MTDRLAELRNRVEQGAEEKRARKADLDCEQLGEELDAESQEDLQAFQTEIEQISASIKSIVEQVVEIETRYKLLLSEHTSGDERASVQASIASVIEKNEKLSEAIRKQLRKIAGENKQFAEKFPQKTGQLRVRVNTHQGITRRFMAAMQSLENVQETHRADVRTAMERQIRTIAGASGQEVEEALRYGQTESSLESSTRMSQLPLEEQRKIRSGLSDLRSRNMDIKKLEESIVKLHKLYQDMQTLVQAQGELLNNIEYNVEETKGATIAAHQELEIARNHQKSANKKKCLIALLIIIIACVIIVPILVKVIPKTRTTARLARINHRIATLREHDMSRVALASAELDARRIAA